METPFDKPKLIIETLNRAGHEAYFVGGSVRDMLLNKEIGDIDIATSALPEEVMSLFPKTIPVGIEHGTVIVQLENELYEVTTFRTEGDYHDYRRPSEVEFVTSLEEDLKRRDLTINAIAMTADGKILDPFKGRDDLKRGIIRTVGDAGERFTEDALRMMRAIRFLSQLGFRLDEQTKQGIIDNAPMLKHISIERISMEFEKMLLGRNNQHALRFVVDTGVYHYLPGLHDRKEKFLEYCTLPLNMLESLEEYWAALVTKLEVSDVKTFMDSWKQPKKRQRTVLGINRALSDIPAHGWMNEVIYEHGFLLASSTERVRAVLSSEKTKTMEARVEKIRRSYENLPIKSRNELAVNGHDLLKWSAESPGPWMAEMLSVIERDVINGKVANNRERIKEWLKKCNRL